MARSFSSLRIALGRPEADEDRRGGDSLAQAAQEIAQVGRRAADLEVRDAHHPYGRDVEAHDGRAGHGAMGNDLRAQAMLAQELRQHRGCGLRAGRDPRGT